MQKMLLQKKLNMVLTAIMSGFLFLNPVVSVAFNEVVPEYATGVFGVADNIEGNLAFYNASRGFFLLPLSANGVSDDMSPTNDLILALPDTIALTDSSEDEKGLVIYRVDGTLWVNAFVGGGNESAHSASYFGVGEFVIVITDGKDQCADLALNECRQSRYFLKETSFSIQ